MIYRFGITTTTAYTKENPLITPLLLTRGVVHQLDVVFPPGPRGTLHLTINDALHQVWPTNPDEEFASDADKISYREHYELEAEPYDLQAYTWLEDATYQHSCIVRIGILPRRILTPWLTKWWERFTGWVTEH